MAAQNFLLGRGERLTDEIVVKLGGGPKQHPYSFGEACKRLVPMVSKAVQRIDKLPEEACPQNEAVISVTLHPEYIAKSYYPTRLLRDVGVKVIGSRPRVIKPEKRSRHREPLEMLTTELFAMGPRTSIRAWSQRLPTLRLDHQKKSYYPQLKKYQHLHPGKR